MNGHKEKSAKLAKLQSLKNPQIGGKGTTRRKKKVVHKTATTDDKKLQNILKKHNLNSIPGIEEVNMIKDDGNVIHFTNPKVQASLAANTFAISGNGETKSLRDLLPGIHNQLVDYDKLSPSIISAAAGEDMATENIDEDEVPTLVGNFDDPSKHETV